MNAEELAREFCKMAERSEKGMTRVAGNAGAYYALEAEGNALKIAAELVRTHLTPAPLQSAAPDMLAALETVMNWINRYPPDFVMDDEWPDVENAALDAIAKAKGTPNV